MTITTNISLKSPLAHGEVEYKGIALEDGVTLHWYPLEDCTFMVGFDNSNPSDVFIPSHDLGPEAWGQESHPTNYFFIAYVAP